MKHLLITDRFLPHAGGSRLYYYNTFLRFPPTDSTVVLTTPEKDSEAFDKTCDLEIIRAERRQSGNLKFLRMQDAPYYSDVFKMADQIIKRRNIDVVHCGEPLPGALVAFWLRRKRRVPFITYAHDEPLGPPTRLQPRLRGGLFRAGNGLVAVCNYAYERIFEEKINPKKVLLAQPGVDLERFSPGAPKEEIGRDLLKDKRPVLLTVGRLEQYKGHDCLLEAIAILLRKGVELTWVIVGAGPNEGQLRDAIKNMELDEYVFMAGKVTDEELVDLYRAADVFALMPRMCDGIAREGFCISYLEAAACGVPVVGSAIGGTGDSIIHEKTGFRICPENTGEVADKILLLLNDGKLRKKLSVNSREYALNFTWERTAEKVWAFTKGIVTG